MPRIRASRERPGICIKNPDLNRGFFRLAPCFDTVDNYDMKVILYMGTTPNGYIAKENGDSEWVSDEDLNGFYEESKKAKNIILGKNTFLEASRQGYFPFPGAVNIVVTHQTFENKWGRDVVFTDKKPKEILSMVEEMGFDTALLAGGGMLNASFAQEGLIDEVYLDIEPLLFGKGIRLFGETDFACELELIEAKNLNKNTVQLHYKVV